MFSHNHNNSESNTYVNLPLEKTVGNNFAIDLGITFDLTRYKPDGKVAINNTAYYISPSVIYRTPTLNIQAGLRPTWDNKDPKIYPNIIAEIGTPDKRFNFIAGWTGYLRDSLRISCLIQSLDLGTFQHEEYGNRRAIYRL